MCVHLCVFGLKGEGEPAGQSQGEPKTAHPAGRYGAGAVQETGGAQLWEGLRWHETAGPITHISARRNHNACERTRAGIHAHLFSVARMHSYSCEDCTFLLCNVCVSCCVPEQISVYTCTHTLTVTLCQVCCTASGVSCLLGNNQNNGHTHTRSLYFFSLTTENIFCKASFFQHLCSYTEKSICKSQEHYHPQALFWAIQSFQMNVIICNPAH